MKKQKLTIMWCLLSIALALCYIIVHDDNKTTIPELVFISLNFGSVFMIMVNLFGGKKYE